MALLYDNNSNFSIYLGKSYEDPTYGICRVIKDYGFIHDYPGGDKAKKLRVRFDNTGYETDVLASQLRPNGIKDPYAKTVHNLGYLGGEYGNTRVKDFKIYNTWKNMIARCYDKNDKNYKNYGAHGITIDNTWFNFSNYYRDIKSLDNYSEYVNSTEYQIDKDFKQQDIPLEGRKYSPVTCTIIKSEANVKLSDIIDSEKTGVYKENNFYLCKYYDQNANKHQTLFNNYESAEVYKNMQLLNMGCLDIYDHNITNCNSFMNAQNNRLNSQTNNKFEYKQMYHLVSKEEK